MSIYQQFDHLSYNKQVRQHSPTLTISNNEHAIQHASSFYEKQDYQQPILYFYYHNEYHLSPKQETQYLLEAGESKLFLYMHW